MLEILSEMKEVFISAISNITSEYVALFSVLVTILIYVLNCRSELKFRKYEHQKPEYEKLISFLSIAYTNNDKLKVDRNGKLSKEIQQEFYDVGASLMVFASKKLYREYLFFRDFTTSEHMKLCVNYDEKLIIYIIANIMRQIRKEVGLTIFNQLSPNEALGFIINDFATNPVQKNNARLMNYKLRMLKVELFFMNRYRFVFLHYLYYTFIKPLFGLLRCVIVYIIALPITRIVNYIFRNKKEKE